MSESKPETDVGTAKESDSKIESLKPRKSRWIFKAFLSLVILLCGVVIGIVVSVGFVKSSIRNFQFRPEVATERVMGRFSRHYDLTDERAVALENVVREHFETLEKIGQEVHPRILAQMKAFGENVAEELDEEQRTDWEKRYTFIRKNFLPQQPFRKVE